MKNWLVVLPLVGLLVACQSNTTTSAVSPSTSPSGTSGSIPMPTDAQLSPASSSVVWALVAGQYLFRSIDQGATWERRAMPAAVGLPPHITFVSDREGWLMITGSPETQCNAEQAAVWHTADGATTWQQISMSGIRDAQCKENISFADARRGFITAWDPNSRPTIYRTTDGGSTWSGAALPDPPGFVSQPGGFTLRAGAVRGFAGTLMTTAVSGDGAEYVFRSGDAGASWTFAARGPQGALELSLLTPTHWIAMQPVATETNDAGATWHLFTTDYQDAAGVQSHFVFADDSVGYGTVRGDVHRTTDGGLHWKLITTSWS